MDFLKDVVDRLADERMEIINTPTYPSRAVKTIYFWMMSQIAAYYWERRYPELNVDVWAKGQWVYVHINGVGSQAENRYYCGALLDDADIDIMFAAFVGMINMSPFHAEGPDVWQNSGQFADRVGMYHMTIHVDGIK